MKVMLVTVLWILCACSPQSNPTQTQCLPVVAVYPGWSANQLPELVKKKSRYILDQQLAGIFMFELTQDTLDDQTSLLSASNQVISPEFCGK